MKKLSIFLGVVALLATSCANDEVLEVTRPDAIGFDMFVNNSTRAHADDDITMANLKKPIPTAGAEVVTGGGFDVWGISWDAATRQTPTTVFVGQNVEWGSGAGGDDWLYSPQKYWVAGKNYRFSALAPAFKSKVFDENEKTMTDNLGVIVVKQDLTELPETFSEVVGGLEITFDNELAKANIDLCHAFKAIENVQTSNPPKVDMTFEHMLSRVKFTFKNGFTSQMTCLKIKDLKITDPQAKAKINKKAGETAWTPVEKTGQGDPFQIAFAMDPRTDDKGEYLVGGVYEAIEPAEGLPQNTQESEHHYIFPLVIEGNGKAYNVSFTVEWWNIDLSGNAVLQNTYNHTVTLPETKYKAGYSYNFTAELNEANIDPNGGLKPIQFTPSVSGWAEFGANDDAGTNTEVPVPIPGN